jgi:hypothetical protein
VGFTGWSSSGCSSGMPRATVVPGERDPHVRRADPIWTAPI